MPQCAAYLGRGAGNGSNTGMTGWLRTMNRSGVLSLIAFDRITNRKVDSPPLAGLVITTIISEVIIEFKLENRLATMPEVTYGIAISSTHSIGLSAASAVMEKSISPLAQTIKDNRIRFDEHRYVYR